jgi:phosphoribosylformylglycinamidine synthase II
MGKMIADTLQLTLTLDEIQYARKHLGREPNHLEWAMIDAEWSEHCSYKSSKPIISQLPTTGSRVIIGPGYDSGVVDIGDGFVLTLHIESHNHPSAIDPYGGAATGIGGVVRDILCMGTTPIAFLDSLRFGDITKSDHSKWLLKNVVRGIADYGNCIGVPTVAGEVEFDESFERNCLVDVASLGVGKKEDLLLAEATHPGDSIYLIGGTTGRDGIHGATFASRTLGADADRDRSAVQIPDPFTKKLIIEATLEATRAGVLRGCKDLGGGGLSTGLSEIADKGHSGVDVYLERIPIREPDMTPTEILISESQERMLLVLKTGSEVKLHEILDKYGVPFACIGDVTSRGTVRVQRAREILADIPTQFLANAPIIERKMSLRKTVSQPTSLRPAVDIKQTICRLLASPTITSKEWIYRQYDHEVGIRTILKPGAADAAVLELPNGKFVAVKVDGNSRLCQLDAYLGAASVLAEACRNIIAVGAEPLAFLDHCQFGDPNDEQIYGAFSLTVKGLADFARKVNIPCVGGKVSFYNQDDVSGRPIKSSPVVAVTGLIEKGENITTMSFKSTGESIILVGHTEPELGGSEYCNLLGQDYGPPPKLDFDLELRTLSAVLQLIREGGITACHDCSKGGLAVALSEMAISGNRGADVDLRFLSSLQDDEILFSEANSRFILTSSSPSQVIQKLRDNKVQAYPLGKVGGTEISFTLPARSLRYDLKELRTAFCDSLGMMMEPWQK